MSMLVGTAVFAHEDRQKRLRDKNTELEQEVAKGSVALHAQEQELDRAREIQTALLPSTLPQLANVQVSGAWQPARMVGGDYFDVIRLDDKRLGICIGDVAGKGISAALLMANLQAAFRAFATAEASPATVCTKLNAFLCANVASGRFITFFYGVLNSEDRTLVYENAGHCPALRIGSNGTSEMLNGEGAVLGVLPGWEYKDTRVALSAGDRIVFYTDGICEAEAPGGDDFGEKRLIDAAGSDSSSALATQQGIMRAVTEFCKGNFRDDATLVVVALQ
jgi:sigma-B regulation protein RsbU (phosphoserine phosphatase)